MPVKRRNAKRRTDQHAEAKAWEGVFDCGADYFDDLPRAGIETGPNGRPEYAVIEEAWHRLGGIFLDTNPPMRDRVFWAVREFGDPSCQ